MEWREGGELLCVQQPQIVHLSPPREEGWGGEVRGKGEEKGGEGGEKGGGEEEGGGGGGGGRLFSTSLHRIPSSVLPVKKEGGGEGGGEGIRKGGGEGGEKKRYFMPHFHSVPDGLFHPSAQHPSLSSHPSTILPSHSSFSSSPFSPLSSSVSSSTQALFGGQGKSGNRWEGRGSEDKSKDEEVFLLLLFFLLSFLPFS